jgi:predicted regulator of Ras-like GTPase activity (Roadblock/LC7/MglB family)
MSCFLCNYNSVAERDAVDELKDQLNTLQGLFPDVAYPSIVNRSGGLVATSLNEEKLGIDLTAIISAIQSAAKHFSLILGMTGCPQLRIEGDSQIFSLYSLHGDYILVYFNNKLSTDGLELDDFSERFELKKIIADINKVLANVLDEP